MQSFVEIFMAGVLFILSTRVFLTFLFLSCLLSIMIKRRDAIRPDMAAVQEDP